MQYDSENINKAKKAGAFDSEMDPLSLGLSNAEKKNLENKLQPHINDLKKKNAKKDSPIIKKAKGRPSKKKLGFWGKIIEFFRSLLVSNSKGAAANKRELKESKRVLLDFHVTIYDAKDNLVKNTFVELLKNIEDQINEFNIFFNQNLDITTDDFMNDRRPSFTRYVIEKNMSMEQTKQLRQLKELDMKHDFKVRGEEGVRHDMDLRIRNFIDSFDFSNTTRLENEFEMFTSILNLRNYNFKGLYSLFSVEEGQTGESDFVDFALENCTVHLRNLDSYFAGIDFRKLREEQYDWFDEFLLKLDQNEKVEPPSSDENVGGEAVGDSEVSDNHQLLKFTTEDFRKMLGSIRKIKKHNIITHFVRVGEERPEYRAKPIINTISYLEKYKKLVETSVKNFLDKSIIVLREEKVADQIELLFEGMKPYEPLQLINNSTNESLKELGFSVFESLFTFNLMKNFIEKIYLERFKRSINSIVVEGEFRKKEMGNEFSSLYYRLDEIYEDTKNIMERISSEGPFAVSLKNFIEKRINNPLAAKKFQSEIESINGEMDANAKSMGMAFVKLFSYMELILQDFKGIRVVDLVNAKSIGGAANRNLMFIYDKFTGILKQLKGIISRFMVIKTSL